MKQSLPGYNYPVLGVKGCFSPLHAYPLPVTVLGLL